MCMSPVWNFISRRGLLLCLAFLAATPVLPAQVTVTGQVELTNRNTGKRLSDASNVVVWLTPLSSEGVRLTPAREQGLQLVQRHKTFEPHLLVVQTGSVVQFPNDDPFFHNVFSLFEGKRFDLGLYEAGSTRSVLFDKPGICYLFCNIHPEMSAVIVVLATPYFAVTGPTGNVSIAKVSPGHYELRVWNERSLPKDLDGLTRQVDISEDAHTLARISILANPNQPTSHKNKYGRDYDTATPPNPLYSQP